MKLTINMTPEEFARDGIKGVEQRFDAEHEQLFTFALDAEHELVGLRTVVQGAEKSFTAEHRQGGGADASSARAQKTRVYADGEWREAWIYDRSKLKPGNKSPGIREQHDAFPIIANSEGQMVVGQFGSFIHGFLEAYDGTIEEGDVLHQRPYSCNGIQPSQRLAGLMPIFHDGRLSAWAAMFGHMTDTGGRVPGSLPTDAQQIFEEGIQIPPREDHAQRRAADEILKICLRNTRVPEWNRATSWR